MQSKSSLLFNDWRGRQVVHLTSRLDISLLTEGPLWGCDCDAQPSLAFVRWMGTDLAIIGSLSVSRLPSAVMTSNIPTSGHVRPPRHLYRSLLVFLRSGIDSRP